MKIERTELGQIKIDGEGECFIYTKNLNCINFVGFGNNTPEVTGFKIFVGNEQTEQTKVEKFKSELKELLIRYDATIEWDAWGDLDGVNDETMNIYVGRDLITKIEGCVVCGDDIE